MFHFLRHKLLFEGVEQCSFYIKSFNEIEIVLIYKSLTYRNIIIFIAINFTIFDTAYKRKIFHKESLI